VAPLIATKAHAAPEILLLWTRNAATAGHVHLILTLLMTATVLTGLTLMPYTLQLANGWTRLAFSANIVACLALVPAVTLLALRYGSVGAACALVAINGATAATVVLLTHRRWLRGEWKRFFGEDVAKPMASALAVVVVARLVFPENAAWIVQMICISAILLCAFAAAAVTAPAIRQTAERILSRLFSWRRRAVSVE